MIDAPSSGRSLRRPRRRSRPSPGRLLIPAAAVALVFAALPRVTEPERAAEIPSPVAGVTLPEAAPASSHGWLFDPAPALGRGTPRLTRTVALAAAPVAPPPASVVVAQAPVAATTIRGEAPPQAMARTEQLVPLPVRRPSALYPAPISPRLALRPVTPRERLARVADAEAERSFFETVFGAKPAPEPQPEAPTRLAYAGVDAEAITPRRSLDALPGPAAEGLTAIYNISARTVTLPSGERLEAHSGLGAAMDNPRLVHLRMRGSTPPGTYELTEREALFHGVRALRLTPVGGSTAIHGRDGILAHTYMLGPSGASNGCVVFREYTRFLQAYQRGEIRRLVVVAGNGQDALPSMAERLFGRSAR